MKLKDKTAVVTGSSRGIGRSIAERFAKEGALVVIHYGSNAKAVRPVLLGAGEHLLNGLNMRALGYQCTESIPGERATHVIIRKVA